VSIKPILNIVIEIVNPIWCFKYGKTIVFVAIFPSKVPAIRIVYFVNTPFAIYDHYTFF